MPKKQIIYETTDGKKFTDQAEAEHHELLAKCREAYREARGNLGKALLSQLTTADGQSVDFGKRNRFYAVLFTYNNPTLAEVVVYWGHWDWELDDLDRLRIIIEWRWPGTRDDTRQIIHIPVSELYADRDKARAAVLAAKQEAIVRLQEELDELKADPTRVRVY